MGQIETSYIITTFLRQVYVKDNQHKYVCIGKLYIFVLGYPYPGYKQYKVIKNN